MDGGIELQRKSFCVVLRKALRSCAYDNNIQLRVPTVFKFKCFHLERGEVLYFYYHWNHNHPLHLGILFKASTSSLFLFL